MKCNIVYLRLIIIWVFFGSYVNFCCMFCLRGDMDYEYLFWFVIIEISLKIRLIMIDWLFYRGCDF